MLIFFLIKLIGSDLYLDTYNLNPFEQNRDEIDDFFLQGLLDNNEFIANELLVRYMDPFVFALFEDAYDLKNKDQRYFDLSLDYFRREILLSINRDEYRYKYLSAVLKKAYNQLVKQWEDRDALIIFELAATYYETIDMEIAMDTRRSIPFVAIMEDSKASHNLSLFKKDLSIETIYSVLPSNKDHHTPLIDLIIRSNNPEIQSVILIMLNQNYGPKYKDPLLSRWLITNITEFNSLATVSFEFLVNHYPDIFKTSDLYATLLVHRESTNIEVSNQASLLLEKHKDILADRNYSWMSI